MKKFYKNIRVLPLILAGLLFTFQAQAQPGQGMMGRGMGAGKHKNMQRLLELKKVQLLEILELSQEQSEKFLAKYNADMKKIIEINSNVQEATLDLRKAIAAKEADAAVKAKTQKLENLQKELNEAAYNRLTSMKEILTADQYAKFLVFEKSFAGEVNKQKEKIRDKTRNK